MKSKRKYIALAAAALASTVLASCGGTKIDSVTLDAESLTLVRGTSEELVATVSPTQAANLPVSWLTSDQNVAGVSSSANGKATVTGVNDGEATITAFVDQNNNKKLDANEKSAQCPVTVVNAIELSETETELLLGDELQLEAEAADPETEIQWTSSTPDVASVDQNGLVKAKKYGTAIITAKDSKDSEVSAACLVTVCSDHVTSFELSTSAAYLILENPDYYASVIVANVGTFLGEESTIDTTITWSVADESVATLVENPQNNAQVALIGVKEGTTKLTAVVGDYEAEDGETYTKTRTVEITVKPAGSAVPANGGFSFVGQTKEKQEILGHLEKYASDTHLTGLTFMGNGGYVMYASNIQKGTNTYIPGYGFGILGEGDITGDLEGETNPEWKRYYHTYESSDPVSLNYMNDKGSIVGDLQSYVSASYFDTQMNDEANGYDWVGDFSKDRRPIAVNANPDGTSDTFKFEVKVGSELKYTTTSSKIASFNNREVELQDYVTAWQIYFTQAYGLARSAENLTGSGSIAGAKAYYEASKNGFNAEAWENVGVKSFVEGGKSYLQFKFNQECTPFYAMYYLASSMYAPVPETFIKDTLGKGDMAAGVKLWGVSSEDGTEGPVDHWLCTGAYAIERWDKNQQIVFKKNANYDDRGRYKIKGVHINILTAAAQDENAAFNEFLANKLSAASIPTTKLAQYKTDPRATMTSSTSNFKLNLNTCDDATWEDLFGVEGSITQTPKSQYWDCEPAMNNDNFVNGLSFAIDRVTLADASGRTPAISYLSDNYLSDPENGISYNSTPEHKAAIAAMIEGTDGYGYSLEKAKASFKAASEELIAAGTYKAGDTIVIEVAWMETSDFDTWGNKIKEFFETAFNSCGGGLKLKVENWAGAEWSDVYYKKMMVGQFDLGFGSVSGNTYDPLNFLEVLKSDNSSGFTLNWGIDTNSVDGNIIYDGKAWSFDALWQAADHGAYVEEGALSILVSALGMLNAPVRNADGSITFTVAIYEKAINEMTYGEGYAACLFATNDADYETYDELYTLKYDKDGNQNATWVSLGEYEPGTNIFVYAITFTAAEVSAFLEVFPNALLYGLDVYSLSVVCGAGGVSFDNTVWAAYSFPTTK